MSLLPTVSATALRPLLEYLRSRGVEPGVYARRLGLDEAQLLDEASRIPAYRLLFMWRHAETLARDPDVGLHVAEHATFTSFGSISSLAVASPTVGDGLRSVQRTTRFLTGGDTYRLEVDGAHARLRRVRMLLEPVERHSTECLLVVPHLYSSRVSARPWRLIEARFCHPRPRSTAEHGRILGCPVQFDAAHDELVFSAALLESPSTMRDDRLAEVLTEVSDRLAGGVLGSEDFVGEARIATWQRLRSGDVSLDGLAKEMALSTRTLQRRLAEHGTSHRQVLDEVRAMLARHLLSAAELGLADIAVMLGFSEQTAFQRAFVKWTGESPGRAARKLR